MSKVCIVGAGMAGLSVAAHLETQQQVDITFVDRNPYPGGRAINYGCKAVDNCVHCGVCLLRDTVEQLPGTNRMLLSSQLVSASRNGNGAYHLQIDVSPNAIDWQKCTECGYCQDACPEKAIKRIDGWKYYADETCTSCGKCVDACPVGAIEMNRQVQHESVEADSVVIATGFQPFDPTINRKWGSWVGSRVITGSDLEHLFFEETYLPPDVKKMAFVQCVGSRNTLEGVEQCSRVCCAYALRMANRLAHEKPDTQIDFYYMDIQRFGKDFGTFWGEVEPKLRFIRSNPISIKSSADGHPIIRYESTPDLSCREEEYDLIVLSHGMNPEEKSEQLADLFGINLEAQGFFDPKVASPGVFVSGTCKTPMRLDECLEDAASVSQKLLTYLEA